MDRRPSPGGARALQDLELAASSAPPSRSATAAPSASWRRSLRAYRTRWNASWAASSSGSALSQSTMPVTAAASSTRMLAGQ